MRLGSSCLERVVIPYTNSSSTNPSAKVMFFLGNAIDSFASLGMTGDGIEDNCLVLRNLVLDSKSKICTLEELAAHRKRG